MATALYLIQLFLLLWQPYSRFTCSQLGGVGHRQCSAAEMWKGCGGRLVEVRQARVGDVVAYHGAHVAIYLRRGWVLDSVPESGVTIHRVPKLDQWYSGPSKIMRWRE